MQTAAIKYAEATPTILGVFCCKGGRFSIRPELHPIVRRDEISRSGILNFDINVDLCDFFLDLGLISLRKIMFYMGVDPVTLRSGVEYM